VIGQTQTSTSNSKPSLLKTIKDAITGKESDKKEFCQNSADSYEINRSRSGRADSGSIHSGNYRTQERT